MRRLRIARGCSLYLEVRLFEASRLNIRICQALPVIEKALCDVLVPNRVPDIRVAEDATGRDVGGAGPYGDRLVLVNEYDEFVVPNSGARFLRRAQTFDARLLDHRFVLVLVRLRLIADVNVRTRVCGLLERAADRQILEFVKH